MGTIREAIEGSKTPTIKWIFLLRIAIRAGSEDSAGEEISEDALDVAIINLTCVKRKKTGLYSVRHKGGDGYSCDRCNLKHERARPALTGRAKIISKGRVL